MKQIIAIDIDDVLAQHADAFVRYSNERWETHLKVDDYDEHWAEIWNVDLVEAQRRRDEFVSSGVHKDFLPNDDAHRVLERLSKDYKLRIVTSRLVLMKELTIEWIMRMYPGVFKDHAIHFAGIWDTLHEHAHMGTKADVLKQIKASYLIDDQLKHCLSAAEVGCSALLFGDYGWNKTTATLPDSITRVNDWKDVERYFYE